jgi:predicted ATP-dependent endonuclease of OLD family
MSSGEQAVFPLIYEFVRLDIAKSLVLIDELELHLHPPQQQALLGALPKIGRDCQFIITTHSPYLADVIPTENEVRLDGGRRSL